jgi:hypothetical protein
MRTTNAKSRQFVQDKIAFKANNLKGVSLPSVYVVYSYDWYPLFAFSYITRKWYENKDRYSVSTSKQRGQCHPQTDTVLMGHEELKDFIETTKHGVTYEQMQSLGVAV